MTRTNVEIAEAFSRHRFDEAVPYLADDVTWTVIGDERLIGKATVIAACERSAEYLSGVTTTFHRFRSVAGGDCVVVDTHAEYTDPDGSTSWVASCDLYDFVAGTLTEVRSYNLDAAPA